MTTDVIIFDCDGVLVDSEPIINRAHAEVLTGSGYPITEADLVERFLGMSDSEMIEIIERERGGPLPFTYAVRVGEIAEQGFRQSLAVIPGVVEALDSLPLVSLRVAPGSDPSQARTGWAVATL
jgi:beta-phosphoglucomutase-like phosphatase (HAD superfamily)